MQNLFNTTHSRCNWPNGHWCLLWKNCWNGVTETEESNRMATTLIGAPVNRVDGRKKVTGSAQYAAEMVLGEMSHGVLVGSAKTSGKILSIAAEAARQAPGVLLVFPNP